MNTNNNATQDIDTVDRLIKILISKDEYFKTNDLSRMLCISGVKLNKSLKELKIVLSYYNLSIKSKPYKGIKISGSELNYQNFLSSSYVQEIVYCDSDKLSSIN